MLKGIWNYDAAPTLRARLSALGIEGLHVEVCPEHDDARLFQLLADADVLWHCLRPVNAELLAQAPDFKPVVLRGEVIPRFGVPPYLRFGNLPLLWLATLCGFVAIMMRRRERELPAAASV